MLVNGSNELEGEEPLTVSVFWVSSRELDVVYLR
jgi:hypothetical protein